VVFLSQYRRINLSELQHKGDKRVNSIQRLTKAPSQWTWNPVENCLSNPHYGRIQIVAVYSDAGQRPYEQPIFLQQLGEFYIVVNEEMRIAFIEIQRHAVIPLEKYQDSWHTWRPPERSTELIIPHPADIHSHGIVHQEIPGGLALNKLQEAEEETGYQVTQVAHLGYLNPDASFYGTSDPVYVCKASTIPSNVPPDPNELIRKVHWLSPEQAQEIETLAMNTCASLFLFRRWALKQKDRFWKEIGEKL
jgi:hypothetical protein